MDQSLRKVFVSSMEMIDQHFEGEGPLKLQVHVDHSTPLADALEISHRMQAGLRGPHAFQVFNPEVVARKVEAEAAVRGALNQIDVRINEANLEIEATQDLLVAVQFALSHGPDVIRVGPSINRRAVAQEQVVFPNNVIMPEGGIGPARKVSMTNKLRFRGLDAQSQTAFWNLNLRALQAKEAAQTVYRDSLLMIRDQMAEAALHQPTVIGSGCSDFTFLF